jgi:hypothetical protein
LTVLLLTLLALSLFVGHQETMILLTDTLSK